MELRNEDIIALAAGLPRDLEESRRHTEAALHFLTFVTMRFFLQSETASLCSHSLWAEGKGTMFFKRNVADLICRLCRCEDLTLHLGGNEELNDDGVEALEL